MLGSIFLGNNFNDENDAFAKKELLKANSTMIKGNRLL